MTPPSSRLDVVLVPVDPDADRPFDRLRDQLVARGWCDAALGPGPCAGEWTDGGFAAIRFERHRRAMMYANDQGGFRVSCPVDRRSLAHPFGAAVEAWRAGGPRRVACACGRVHALEDLAFAPPAAFARVALGAASGAVGSDGLATVVHDLGPVRSVWRRVACPVVGVTPAP